MAEKGGVMNVQGTLSGVQDLMAAKRVYGEPYEHNGLTIIPAAAVRGGGGGGADDAGQGGAGFGVVATPKGAWVIEGDKVTWKPAVDVNRVIMGGQIVAFAVIMTVREIVKLRAQRQKTMRRLLPLRRARRSRLERLLA